MTNDSTHKSLRTRMLVFDIAGLGVWLFVFIFVYRHLQSKPPESLFLWGEPWPLEVLILGLVLVNGLFFVAIGRWNVAQIDHKASILPVNLTDKVYWLLLIGSVSPVLVLQQIDSYFLRDSILMVFLLLLCTPSMNRLPPWIAIGVVVGLMILFTLSSSVPNKWYFCFMMTSYGIANWALFLGVMAQASSRQQINQTNQQLQQANATLTAMLERNERLRISRDLHDDMGHDLSALNLQLQLCKSVTKDEVGEQLAIAQASARQLYSELRELVRRLRVESTTSLDDGLKALVAGCDDVFIDIENHLFETPATWIQSDEWLLFIKKCINQIKPSGSRKIKLKLSCNDRWLIVSMTDELGALSKLQKLQTNNKNFVEKLEQVGGRVELRQLQTEVPVLELMIPVLVHKIPVPLQVVS